jgi:hypothetical protein
MPTSDAPTEDAPTEGRRGGELAGVSQRVAGDASPQDVGDGTDPVDLPSGDSAATVLTFSADDETDQELADEEAREAGEAGGRSVAAVAFSDSDSGAEDQDQSGSSA